MFGSNLMQNLYSGFGSSFASFSSLSSSSGSDESNNFIKSTTKSTKVVNGRKFVTTK